MADYHYSFFVDSKTLIDLRTYTEREWKRLFDCILNNRAIEPNIDFSNSLYKTRLFEVYDLVCTYDLDPGPFQIALVQTLIEYYDKPAIHQKSLAIIQAVDYVQPSVFYEEMLLLVTSPANRHMLSVTTGEGFSLYFYLVNAIMKFDLKGDLYNFLMAQCESPHQPEFYQIVIRYLYIHNKGEWFNKFMTQMFTSLADDEVMRYVLLAIDEYSFYKPSLFLIFNWLFNHRKQLEAKNLNVFQKLSDSILDWLVNKERRLQQRGGYFPLFAFVSSNKNLNQLTYEVLNRVVLEVGMDNKSQLLYFLGMRNPMLRFEDRKVELTVKFPDGKSMLFMNSQIDQVISLFDGVSVVRKKREAQNLLPFTTDLLIASDI
jgi:hypothetical protein